MSDERLRELERRWKESGSAEDGAAWLVVRVRKGELSRTTIKTCALLGHPACRLARMDWQHVEGLGADRVDDVTGLYRLQTLPLQRALQLLTTELMRQAKRQKTQHGRTAIVNAWLNARSPRSGRSQLLGSLSVALKVLSRSKRKSVSLQLAGEILDGTYPELAKAELRHHRLRPDDVRQRLLSISRPPPGPSAVDRYAAEALIDTERPWYWGEWVRPRD